MTAPGFDVSAEAKNFNWLVKRFTDDTAGVHATMAVSSDGLLIALSPELERANADRLAAICSTTLNLAHGVAESYPLGEPDKVVIELAQGYLLICTLSMGCVLGVLASNQVSLGTVAYEIAVFANRASEALSPGLIKELKHTVGS
ncbi:roadblock/LC7 domain-containing protein [Streptomyces sp. KR80]|uniref:roadblock/LC7 domain-containing protein n=1 Tax=Streptomyces sp. KR80 TaxID=3457426 RepID=UPI003FD407D2